MGFDDSRAPLGELFRRLADDTSDLLRRETQLAKLELKETATTMARQGVWLGVAAGLAVGGGLSLLASLVVLLGALMGGLYWLSALIVGVVFLVVAGVIANRAVRRIKEENLTPEETLSTLNEDARWAKREAKDFRREVMS